MIKKKSRLEYIQTKIRLAKTKRKETTQIKKEGYDRYFFKWAGIKERAHCTLNSKSALCFSYIQAVGPHNAAAGVKKFVMFVLECLN